MIQSALIAVAASLGVGLLAVLATRLLRISSPVVALVAVVGVAVCTVVGGVLLTAQAMFISGHDAGVLLAIAVVAGMVGTLVASLLGRRILMGFDSVREAVRGVGGDTFVTPAPQMAELAKLSEELAATHHRLVTARRQERAAEDSRRQLVAWVSHDLRTPLAGLRAMAEALEDGVVDDPAEVADYHVRMRVEVDRLSGLVDDMFELSRISAGALRLTMADMRLDQLITDALASTRPVASADGVRLAGRFDPDVPVVRVDASEFGRVLRNLLSNAIQHTPRDGTVEVAGGRDGADIYVAVTDACGGIPAADLDRVFESAGDSGRASAPRRSGSRGGLGLAIARGIVEAHGGRIEVANVGNGCRFVVRLPMPA